MISSKYFSAAYIVFLGYEACMIFYSFRYVNYKIIRVSIFLFLLSMGSLSLRAQNSFKAFDELLTPPKNYVIKHTKQALKVDGVLEEEDWQKAAWTTDFVDIEGTRKPLPFYKTQVKMLWSDSVLYIAAQLQEPQIWATQLNHDDIIFKDNDFEIFIDPDGNGHDYFEIEINALNKIFDLFIAKPYRNGGNALFSWNVPGLKSAVKIDGTINDANDIDKSWTIEMAIPLKTLYKGHPFKMPGEGDLWRLNFSRVQWDTKISKGKNVKLKDAAGRELPERNWVWSPQGLIDMHYPERWGYLQFTRQEGTEFKLPYQEHQKKYLWLVYYRQKQHKAQFGKYAATLKALGILADQTIMGRANQLKMQTTSVQFTASISVNAGKEIFINDDGLIHQ